MDLISLFTIVQNLLGIACLGAIFTYLNKLETIGCACAEHPYRKFIRGYTIFAILFLLITLVVPVKDLVGSLGQMVFMWLNVAFVLASLIYFVLVIIYARYLTKAKCACSEDIRRDVMYIYSIVEIIVLASLVLLPRALEFLNGAVDLVQKTASSVSKSAGDVTDTIRNPVKAVKKFPGSFKKNVKDVRSSFKRASRSSRR